LPQITFCKPGNKVEDNYNYNALFGHKLFDKNLEKNDNMEQMIVSQIKY